MTQAEALRLLIVAGENGVDVGTGINKVAVMCAFLACVVCCVLCVVCILWFVCVHVSRVYILHFWRVLFVECRLDFVVCV